MSFDLIRIRAVTATPPPFFLLLSFRFLSLQNFHHSDASVIKKWGVGGVGGEMGVFYEFRIHVEERMYHAEILDSNGSSDFKAASMGFY